MIVGGAYHPGDLLARDNGHVYIADDHVKPYMYQYRALMKRNRMEHLRMLPMVEAKA